MTHSLTNEGQSQMNTFQRSIQNYSGQQNFAQLEYINESNEIIRRESVQVVQKQGAGQTSSSSKIFNITVQAGGNININ